MSGVLSASWQTVSIGVLKLYPQNGRYTRGCATHFGNHGGSSLVDLFATRLKFRLANFIFSFKDPVAMAMDAFLFSWDHLDLYAFPLFPLVRQVLSKLQIS